MVKSKIMLSALLCAALGWSSQAMATSTTYYAKAKVSTTEGMGKVYVKTGNAGAVNEEDFQIEMEASNSQTNDQNFTFTAYATAPTKGYTFDGWYEGDTKIMVDRTYTFTFSSRSTDESTPGTKELVAKYDNLKEMSNKVENWYTDMSGVETQEFQAGVTEVYCGNSSNAEGKVLYQKLTGLKNGHYRVEFLAAASAAQWGDGGVTSGEGLALAYIANETAEIYAQSLNVIERTEAAGDISNYDPITVMAEIEVTDGTLEYGVRIPTGTVAGNWFTCQPLALFCLDAEANLAISSAKWGTFCAPFDVEIPEGVKAYTVSLDPTNELVKEEVTGTMEACLPYLVYSDSPINMTFSDLPKTPYISSVNGCMYGNFDAPCEITPNAGNFVLQVHGSEVGFYQVKQSGMMIGKNRAYLQIPVSVSAKTCYLLSDDETTAIQRVTEESSQDNTAIFDMSGRRVNAAQKGLYIKNGKKVLVK